MAIFYTEKLVFKVMLQSFSWSKQVLKKTQHDFKKPISSVECYFFSMSLWLAKSTSVEKGFANLTNFKINLNFVAGREI